MGDALPRREQPRERSSVQAQPACEHRADWSHPVHPTQIYESALSLAIAAFCLLVVHGRKRYDGQVFATFLGLYAIGRFALEYLRADDRGGLLSLSTSQLIGLALLACAIAIHVKRGRSIAASPAATAPG